INPGSEGDNLMQTINVGRLPGYLIALSCVMLITATGRGQSTTQKQSQDQGNEVVRVNTELVQTDVMVFDKRGHFVDGLKPEQFALQIDGISQAISIFMLVTVGLIISEATAIVSLAAI